MDDQSNPPRLRRSITLPLLVAYGVGTMVGAGFYALLGRVAHHAGMRAPWGFLLAALIALVTAMSFSELASRFPSSAGAARFVDEAFGRRWLSALIGVAVICTGVVSAATLSRAFVGFAQDLFNTPTAVGIVAFVALLTIVAVRGILQSVWLAATITVIEVGGLIWVLLTNYRALAHLPERWSEVRPTMDWECWSGVLVASFLAFYAFIGFEDLVNEAEEVQHPRRNVPRGILLALGVTTLLYLLISTVAVLAVSPDQLADSSTPLALLVQKHGEAARVAMTVISLLAGVNGALVQLIMASRITYGMADQGLGPKQFAVVDPKYQTPIYATLAMAGLILVFALWLPLESLARLTSTIMLVNFAAVNAALVRLKNQPLDPSLADQIAIFPKWIPALGFALCVLFLAVQLFASLG